MVGRVALRARGGGARRLCPADRAAVQARQAWAVARRRDRRRAVHAQFQPRLCGRSARGFGTGGGRVRADVRAQCAARVGVSGASADRAIPCGFGGGRGRRRSHVPRSARAIAFGRDRAGAGDCGDAVRVHRQCGAGGAARAAAAVPGAARGRARLRRAVRLRGRVDHARGRPCSRSRRAISAGSRSWVWRRR